MFLNQNNLHLILYGYWVSKKLKSCILPLYVHALHRTQKIQR